MEYEATKLLDRFIQLNTTYDAVSSDTDLPKSTVHRIVNFGRGRAANVDKVAKALGFKNGRRDVMLANGRRKSA